MSRLSPPKRTTLKITALAATVWWICALASAKAEIVFYWAPGFNPETASEEAEVNQLVRRLHALNDCDASRQLSSPSASLLLARRLVVSAGLQVAAENLGTIISKQMKLRSDLHETHRPFSVERIVVFDKELARNRNIPEELHTAIQYRTDGDVLSVKDSPARWILIRDSSVSPDRPQQLWVEGLRDHEWQTIDQLQRKAALEMYISFLDICAEHFDLPSNANESAAGKILIAWSAVLLIYGQFHADRAFADWMKPRSDQQIPALVLAAGGEEILTKRFADWMSDRSAKLKAIGKFILK